jgi:hypothetical protein
MFLEQGVVDVVARIAFVAGKIDRPIDIDGQIGVDLDDAAEAALVPVVRAPRLAGDVLDGELLVRRQRDMCLRSRAAFADRCGEDGVKLLARNDELLPEVLVPLDERARTGKSPIELGYQVGEVRFGKRGRRGVVQYAGFLVELGTFAVHDSHPHAERGELTIEVLVAQPFKLDGRLRDLRERRVRLACPPLNVVERRLRRFGGRSPLGRAVIGVHVIGVVLAEGEDQLYVLFGDGIHVGARRQQRGQCQDEERESHRYMIVR